MMLLDLDNTLIDRDAAFRAAAAAFLPGADLDWVMTLDGGGYTPRDQVAAALADRYPGAAIDALLDTGGADRVVLEDACAQALTSARAAGWTCVIVTNGRIAQQETKIRRTGLDRLVDGWAISEAIGHKKPAPEIFHAAAGIAGLPLRDAWVIGDSARADIGGAAALGLPSVWVSNHRPWSETAYEPTAVAADAASAIHRLLSATGTA